MTLSTVACPQGSSLSAPPQGFVHGVNAQKLIELARAVARQQGTSMRARMTEEAEQKALESELQGLEEELKQQEARIRQLEETKTKLQRIVAVKVPLTPFERQMAEWARQGR